MHRDDVARLSAQQLLENTSKVCGRERASAVDGPGPGAQERVEPRSGKSYAIQFTASAQLVRDIERARELLSHAIPSGRLCAIFERALRTLLRHETKQRIGSDKPRKPRKRKACERKPRSRHIPVAIQRAVRQRDGDQCAFVDERGVRCEERRFLCVEHKEPFACEGETSVDNCCLHCTPHNLLRAKQVYGDELIDKKIAQKQLSATLSKIQGALVNMGFKPRQAKQAVAALSAHASPNADLPTLLRAAFQFLAT